MEDVRKYVDFTYVVGGILSAWLAIKLVESIWQTFEFLERHNPVLMADIRLSSAVGVLIGIGIVIYLRLNQKVYGLVTECGIELKKTIWPGWNETKHNTVVVIIVVFIMSFSLWFFDVIWRTLTNVLYK